MNINEKLKMLHLDQQLRVENLPQVDLYMDQVIQLFENIYGDTLRNDSEKVLTKTMINNYSKGKLLFPGKNKKYSTEHLILMSLIYQLKGGLSISDIQTALNDLNQKLMKQDNFSLKPIYQSYLSLIEKNTLIFEESVKQRIEEVEDETKELNELGTESIEKFLLVASFIQTSNMYRRLAELIIDEIKVQED